MLLRSPPLRTVALMALRTYVLEQGSDLDDARALVARGRLTQARVERIPSVPVLRISGLKGIVDPAREASPLRPPRISPWGTTPRRNTAGSNVAGYRFNHDLRACGPAGLRAGRPLPSAIVTHRAIGAAINDIPTRPPGNNRASDASAKGAFVVAWPL